MPIKQPIESVVNQLSEKPQFIFASATELNDLLDNTKKFPVVGLVAETAINLLQPTVGVVSNHPPDRIKRRGHKIGLLNKIYTALHACTNLTISSSCSCV
jgi:hypothetical protein